MIDLDELIKPGKAVSTKQGTRELSASHAKAFGEKKIYLSWIGRNGNA